ncbi:MAG: MetQ/NlpA family ABC transporter substrate-binding protein [Atopobiaceae bacterium]|nr:MetQ/NlpA family ABC transporter substrate-binding protein [Atopobiaceae bacterium]
MVSINHKHGIRALTLTLAAVFALAIALTGCGGSGSTSGESASKESATSDDTVVTPEVPLDSADKVIVVGASPTPHAEILNAAVKPALEAEGWTLEVKEFTDYVLPNTATEDGELDANYFQHIPYLEDFNEQQGTHLVNVAGVHIEPMRIYAGKTATLSDLADGALVAVPNDATNEGRALLLLEAAGVITLDENAGVTATPADIKDNPKNLEFKEVEAATVPTVRADVDIAVINTNYALEAKIPADEILYTESGDSPYVNVLVVKEGNENSEKTQALVKAITSKDVKDYIEKTYPDGEVVPVV